jgi:hypothetical protein
MESANIQTRWAIDGYNVIPAGKTKSCSFFDVHLSNHCGDRDNIAMTPKETSIKDFDKVDSRSLWLGASQLAVGTQHGAAVAPANTNVPFGLVFNPASGLNSV